MYIHARSLGITSSRITTDGPLCALPVFSPLVNLLAFCPLPVKVGTSLPLCAFNLAMTTNSAWSVSSQDTLAYTQKCMKGAKLRGMVVRKRKGMKA